MLIDHDKATCQQKCTKSPHWTTVSQRGYFELVRTDTSRLEVFILRHIAQCCCVQLREQ